MRKHSEHVSQKTYELCVFAQLKHTYRLTGMSRLTLYNACMAMR